MIKQTMSNGDVYVQAWNCGRSDHPGMFVYTQSIAIDKMAEGFDVAILVIVRHANGDKSYLPGVVLPVPTN